MLQKGLGGGCITNYRFEMHNPGLAACPIPTPTPAIMEMEGLGKPQCNSKGKIQNTQMKKY